MPEREVGETHVAAVLEEDELRTEPRLGNSREIALRERHVPLAPLLEKRALRGLLVGSAPHPRLPTPHPRMQDALPGDGDVGRAVRVDERRPVEALDALPARLHGREVLLEVVGEKNVGPLFEMEFDIAP